MSTHTLRYESPDKLLILAGDCDTHLAHIDQWQVSEVFSANTHPDIGAGSYRIVLEAMVTTLDEELAACGKAIEIAEQFDIAWCYLFGEPFKAVRRVFALTDGPPDWRGNFREVQVAIQREAQGMYCAAMQIANRTWLGTPFLPLQQLLKIRTAYLAASPMLRQLIELHVSAHRSPLGNLFMLAKALEVVGRHYGETRAVRNSGMQLAMDSTGLTSHVKQNVAWLFDIANERYDIRHAVDNKAPGVSLHPKLTQAERRDFEHDATLIVRAFICEQLGVDVHIVATK